MLPWWATSGESIFSLINWITMFSGTASPRVSISAQRCPISVCSSIFSSKMSVAVFKKDTFVHFRHLHIRSPSVCVRSRKRGQVKYLSLQASVLIASRLNKYRVLLSCLSNHHHASPSHSSSPRVPIINC